MTRYSFSKVLLTLMLCLSHKALFALEKDVKNAIEAESMDDRPSSNGSAQQKEETSGKKSDGTAKNTDEASPEKKDEKAEAKKEIPKYNGCDDLSSCYKKKEVPIGPPFLVPLSLGECGAITWKPGLRIQARYTYDQATHNNDFFIPRVRFKCGGDAFGLARYYAELKIDNTGRYEDDPRARIENAWLDFPLWCERTYLRVGLYDLPFSRDALTSDAKLLFIDRSLIKDELTRLGLADNTIGIMLHGRPLKGRFEYYVGIFDNEVFEKIGSTGTRESDQLMPAARFVWNLFDPQIPPEGYADYLGSYLCKGHRLALGINGAYLGGCEDEDADFEIWAYGVDLFYSYRRYTFQAEIDWFHEDSDGYGWYVQGGYLFWGPWEFAVRYQELDPTRGFDTYQRWTTIGLNCYIREHYLKVQTNYIFKDQEDDLFLMQLQLDF